MPKHVDVLIRDLIHPGKDAAELSVITEFLTIKAVEGASEVCEGIK
jgi:hypothetical protein